MSWGARLLLCLALVGIGGTGVEVPDDWAVAVDEGVASRTLRLGAMIADRCEGVELWSLSWSGARVWWCSRLRPRSRLMDGAGVGGCGTEEG